MSRARDIANFGDGIATADIDDGAVTAGKLNSTLDLSGKTVTLPSVSGGIRQGAVQAVVAELSQVGFTSAGSWVNLGDIEIPASGIWLIRADLRLRGGGVGYVKSRLGTSSSGGEIGSSGGGANTAIRMLKEQLAHEGSFYNIHVSPGWILDMPTGLTYGENIYLHIYPNSSDSMNLNNNDSNGQPVLTAIKLNETTTTGTTIETIGGA